MKYRHVVIQRTGGPEVLQLVEDELPIPETGQARIKVLAADVSFSDVNIRRSSSLAAAGGSVQRRGDIFE